MDFQIFLQCSLKKKKKEQKLSVSDWQEKILWEKAKMNLVLEITSQFRHLGCLKEKTISSNKTYSRHEYSMKKDEIDIIHFEDLI